MTIIHDVDQRVFFTASLLSRQVEPSLEDLALRMLSQRLSRQRRSFEDQSFTKACWGRYNDKFLPWLGIVYVILVTTPWTMVSAN